MKGPNPPRVSQFLSKCEKENIELPQDAINELKKKFGVSNKRNQPEDDQGDDGESEEMPHHKRIKLAEEARERPAVCPENQKIVDAFIEYGVSQLEQGHTGKGVSHLRAANAIRDYDQAIKSGAEARQVGYVGDLMARQVDEILRKGKIIDNEPELNASRRDYDHNAPQIVQDLRNSPAKVPANQKIVNALAEFGEHELQYGNTGKGVSHLRAARSIQGAKTEIKSGQQARYEVDFIGDVMIDKIDQILEHGKVVHDEGKTYSGTERVRGDPAPIVQDLLDNPAKRPENQKIVDALRDYGDVHLSSGHRGKGISHLRAAKEIRNSEEVMTSGKQAQRVGMVGQRIAKKVDQIIHQGHADSDEDCEPGDEEGYDGGEEEGSGDQQDYGERHSGGSGKGNTPPIVRDVRSSPAKCKANQPIVDALVDYGESELRQYAHTGRGITYLRAARQLRDYNEEIKSGAQAKKIGMIGIKVATFIDQVLEGQQNDSK
ncbi:hypothetical protein FI667_g7036, partial [Globisporangium splendens]